MIYDFKASGNYFKLDFDIQLKKDQQVYCFIGENGIGKTKLLQTLANIVIYYNTRFNYDGDLERIISTTGNTDKFLAKDIRRLLIDMPNRLDVLSPIENRRDMIVHIGRNHKQTSIDSIFDLSIKNRKKIVLDKPIIFISAKNRGYINGINDSRTLRLDGGSNERFIKSFMHTYNSIYDKEIENDSVTNWLLQRLVMANPVISGTEGLRKEVTFVLECLNKFAPELNLLKYDEDNKPVINCSYENGDFYIAGIAIQNLSTGYASILRIIQEIVAGLSDWDNNVDLHNADGIVFIDEIDLHLHPKWQFKIIDFLKEFFPKVIFYITTHSPLVLFNLKNGEGYKLHKDENNLVTAEPVEQNNMQFVGDVIKKFFDVDGVSIRKTDKQSMMQARKNLLDLIAENQDEQ